MIKLTPDHPAVVAAERAATQWMEDSKPEPDLNGTVYMLNAALPYLADDTPDGIGNENPWKPVENRTVRIGDEVRRELFGVSTTATVARADYNGHLWTAKGGYIGNLEDGVWYYRQPNLPDRDGASIIPTDPAVGITTSNGRKFTRLTYSKDYSVWVGIDVHESKVFTVESRNINPGVWKIEI